MTSLTITNRLKENKILSNRVNTDQSKVLKLVSLKRANMYKHQLFEANNNVHSSNFHQVFNSSSASTQKNIHLSPTTIPTLLSNGILEDASQFQQIINERKCKHDF